MSATTSSLTASPPNATQASTSAEITPALAINTSCQLPLLLLFVKSAAWLLAGSVIGLAATLKFHNPNFLADHAWTTYGRLHPAQTIAFIYGFAVQAVLGVALWIIAHLGRTRLAMTPAIVAGCVIWNLGVFLGIAGVLAGEMTGYEWLEMPRFAAVFLFAGYLLIGLAGLATHRQLPGRAAYTSLWFLLAALFWFPWIFSTAGLLLLAWPVRGVMQAALDWWYMNNLSTVFFGCAGLGAIFYFIPKILRRPLYSHALGLF